MAIFSAIIGAIQFAGAFVGGFIGGALGLSATTIGTLGALGANLAVLAVLSLASRALQPGISVPRQEIQAIIEETDAPRRVYIGKNLMGGIRTLWDVRDGWLYQLVAVAHGHLTEFDNMWIDGVKVSVNAEGYVTDDPFGYGEGLSDVRTATIASGDGGDYTVLRQKFSYWTDDHRLTNIATFLVMTQAPPPDQFSKVFPRGPQTLYQWDGRGQRLYDPRSESAAYSDNAALAMLHYLRHPDGFRRKDSEINFDSWAEMADVADIPIDQKSGGTSPNLRLWGYWTLDEEPRAVLDRMTGSCGIRAYETQDGTIGALGGNFGDPACTITTKDIASLRRKTRVRERSGYNILKVFFLSEAQKFTMFEVDPWRDETRLAQEGEISTEYHLEMCPDLSQARRLAKKQLYDDNREEIEIITNLVGLKARYPGQHGQRHTIMLDYQPEDGSGRVIRGEYEVDDHYILPDMTCRIKLLKVDRATEAWSPAEEGTQVPEIFDFGTDQAPEIEATLTQVMTGISGALSSASLKITAVPIPDRPDIRIQARYRKTGETAWINMSVTDFTARSGAVDDGAEYQAQVRFQGVFSGVDEWETLGPITIQVDATPPGSPSGLFASNGSGSVYLSWRNPNGPFAAIRIYRGTTTNPAGAALVGTTGGASGQVSEYQDDTVSLDTQYRYWVAAANVSGVEGVWAGPAVITTA